MRRNRPDDRRHDSNHRVESGRREMGGTKIPTMLYNTHLQFFMCMMFDTKDRVGPTRQTSVQNLRVNNRRSKCRIINVHSLKHKNRGLSNTISLFFLPQP